MTTLTLIKAIAESLIVIYELQKESGDDAAEILLKRLQALMNKARPLALHTQN